MKIQKNTRKELVVYSFIISIICTQAVYFLSDPSVILTKLQSQIVIDKVSWEETLDLKMWAEYIAMPLVYAFGLTQTQKVLFGNKRPEFDRIKSSWKIAIVIIIIGFIAYFLFNLLSEII